MTREHTTDAILATPPVSAGAAVLMGMSLNTWIAVFTIIYTLIMIVAKLPAMVHAVKTLLRWIHTRKVDDVESN